MRGRGEGSGRCNSFLFSFSGPAQLSVACSTILEVTENWAGPGNKANSFLNGAF